MYHKFGPEIPPSNQHAVRIVCSATTRCMPGREEKILAVETHKEGSTWDILTAGYPIPQEELEKRMKMLEDNGVPSICIECAKSRFETVK